ncbi:hypothetical protein ACH0BF_16835 [Pseudobacillus sp. 179-B 2D1 NHS]|uniref:hypothetical protein n=1 Tax=Pseudobacillus sp. 179-B 2D1 NHS TaxID=3374292 RepID=UPI003879203C
MDKSKVYQKVVMVNTDEDIPIEKAKELYDHLVCKVCEDPDSEEDFICQDCFSELFYK